MYKVSKFQMLQFASCAFLCEQLPDNWENLDEEARDEFLELNVWGPIENYSADAIYDLIENHALYLEEHLMKWGLIDNVES